jgi:hypothetical protein
MRLIAQVGSNGAVCDSASIPWQPATKDEWLAVTEIFYFVRVIIVLTTPGLLLKDISLHGSQHVEDFELLAIRHTVSCCPNSTMWFRRCSSIRLIKAGFTVTILWLVTPLPLSSTTAPVPPVWIVVCQAASAPLTTSFRRGAKWVSVSHDPRQQSTSRWSDTDTALRLLLQVRGGDSGSFMGEQAVEEFENDNYDNDNDDDDNESPTTSKADSTSTSGTTPAPEPLSDQFVAVTIRTSTGSKLLDSYPLEFENVGRQRNVAFLKASVSRKLPSKPPVSAIWLTRHGQILDDATLVDDLMDEDDQDDDEDDEENETGDSKGLVLQLDMIPSVDPNFLADLDLKLADCSVSELLDAYATNEAVVWENAAALQWQSLLPKLRSLPTENDPNQASSVETTSEATANTTSRNTAVLWSTAIRERAREIRQTLEGTVLNTKPAQSLLQTAEPEGATTTSTSTDSEVKGERKRRVSATTASSGSALSGGASGGGWKSMLQHHFNVDWGATVRHVLLFLFFGWFGGRTATSRAILLLGAPSVVVLQARPVKMWLRQVLYAVLDHPPSVFLSLLPAPQQAILSLHMSAAMQTLYGNHLVSAANQAGLPNHRDTAPLPVESDDDDDDDDDQEDNDEELEVDDEDYDSSED